MARILVVDDQITILKMIEGILVKQSHIVTLAADAYDAIEKVKNQPFEMVITDAMMPGGVSGYDLVKTLRGDPNLKGLPIILLTGKREKKDVERGIESGADDYCVKPVDPDLFLARVNALLNRKPGGEVKFTECSVSEAGEFKTPLQIIGISEVGLSFHSPQPFHVGAKIKLDTPFFAKIGIESPNLRVMMCDSRGDNYLIRVQYIGLSESSLQPIRTWILGHSVVKAG